MRSIDIRKDLLPLKDKIYRLGLRITQNAQDAEDLTQDTLMKAWSQRDKLAEVDSIEAYCMTICKNLAFDRIARKDYASLSLDDEGVELNQSFAPSPEEQYAANDKLQRIHQLFNSLPPKLRTALQLRDIEGFTYQEAAAAMEVTEDNFKVMLHRARKAVKCQYESLENYGL